MATLVSPQTPRGPQAPPGASATLPAVPTAVRSRRAGWRDPRLWVGLVLVAASVVLGARLMGDADRTVPVWAVRTDLGEGAGLTPADLEVRRVRFTSGADGDRYLSAGSAVPAGSTLTRDVGAGELLPRGSLTSAQGTALDRFTVVFQGAGAPVGLAQGDRVDVYVTSVRSARATGEGTAVAALRSALVLDSRTADGSLSGTGGQEVTLGVPRSTDLTGLVQAAKTDHLYLVQVD